MEVDKIVFMPIFYIKEFDFELRTMVAEYDKKGHKSVIQYFQKSFMISISAKEVSKVFGVPN